MVAITVILAAVIGTFVLGLGDQVQDSAPNVNFAFDYDSSTFTVTHDGGEDFEAKNVEIQHNSGTTDGTDSSAWGSGTVSTGDETNSLTYSSGETIRIVWKSPSGGSSQTLGESDAPS